MEVTWVEEEDVWEGRVKVQTEVEGKENTERR
jgi:hypothetical protein